MSRLSRLGYGLSRFGIGLLPRAWRDSVIRNRSRVDEAELKNIDVVRIASSVDEHVEAAKLVHDGYVDRGIMLPHGSGIRMTHYLLLPTSLVFVAIREEQVVGTLSLVIDGPLGLPMEKIYRTEVEQVRHEGRKIAEVGALCVANGVRGTGILFLLCKVAYRCAANLMGVDNLLIAVHPKVACLYEANLGYEKIGPSREYPALERSAIALPLRLKLQGAEESYRAAWGHLPKNAANPYWMYFERVDPQIQVPPDTAFLGALQDLHRRAAMKLAALRPDIIMELDPEDFDRLRMGMGTEA